MTKKQAAHEAVRLLKEAYPDAICSLEYRKPHELMIATRLAAQCTDARVNIVCVDLFDKYRSVRDFAEANLTDVEEIIKSCGLYKTKAHDIIAMCQMLMEKYNGELPDTVGDVFHKPAIVCDTHCIRITNLLGLTEGKDPVKVENQLRPLLPPEESNDFCHRLVLHGRAVCVARRPQCDACVLKVCCKHYKDTYKLK